MAIRLNITVDEDIAEFVEQYGAGNRSAFVNEILRRAKALLLEEKLKQACLEEAQDETYQAELSLWDVCSQDGLVQGLIP